MDSRFTIFDEITRQYRRFNTVGTQLTARLLPPSDKSDPISHFLDSVNDLCKHALRKCNNSDMVGISIRNETDIKDKAIGISFRRKDQLSTDVVLNVWEKVIQSNSRFNVLDTLVLEMHSLTMPVGFGRAIKTEGRQLDVVVHLKKSIVQGKSETNCLAHALFIAIAKITNDRNYKSYRNGRKMEPVVRQLIETTGIKLDQGGGIRELIQFQEHFKEYGIVVYSGLNCDIYFDGQIESENKIDLLYDECELHYHVINNITGLWQNSMSVKAVTKDDREALHTSAIRRVATACPFLHVHFPMFEFLASHEIDTLEVRYALTSIR